MPGGGAGARRYPRRVGETGGLVEVGGHRLAVRRGPAPEPGAPTVLYVHGLGGSATNWSALVRELGPAVDSHAIDLPGFGESPPAADGDHTLAAQLAAVTAYAESLGAAVHLVGNSMGGLLAVLLAAQRPDLVATLTLVSPTLPGTRLARAARWLTLFAVPGLGERLLRRSNAVPVESQVARLTGVLYGDPRTVTEAMRATALDERRQRLGRPHADATFLHSLRSLVAALTAPPRRSPWRAAAAVRAPTLVLVGGKDLLVHPSTAQRWRRRVPSARVVVLPGVGHVAMMERPAVVAAHLREQVGLPVR